MAGEKLGPYLKAVRRNRGLTQKQVAKAVGVSQPFLSGVEGGRWTPPDDRLEDLAHYLRVDIYQLLSRADSASASDDPRHLEANVSKALRCECGRRPFRKQRAATIVSAAATLRELAGDLEAESKYGTPRGEQLCRALISQVKRLEDALGRR